MGPHKGGSRIILNPLSSVHDFSPNTVGITSVQKDISFCSKKVLLQDRQIRKAPLFWLRKPKIRGLGLTHRATAGFQLFLVPSLVCGLVQGPAVCGAHGTMTIWRAFPETLFIHTLILLAQGARIKVQELISYETSGAEDFTQLCRKRTFSASSGSVPTS